MWDQAWVITHGVAKADGNIQRKFGRANQTYLRQAVQKRLVDQKVYCWDSDYGS